VSGIPPSTASSCRSSHGRWRGRSSNGGLNPPRGSPSGGRVDAEEDPQEDFLALGALIEDERGQSTDYQVRQGHVHDLVGDELSAAAYRSAERPAGERPTRSTCASSRALDRHRHPQSGAKGAIGPPKMATAVRLGGPGSRRSSTRCREGRIRCRSPHPFRRRKPLFWPSTRCRETTSRARLGDRQQDCRITKFIDAVRRGLRALLGRVTVQFMAPPGTYGAKEGAEGLRGDERGGKKTPHRSIGEALTFVLGA
jgi:hypothetical protein